MSQLSLSKQINESIKNAMKSRNATSLTVLRALKAAIKNVAIEKHGGADSDLDDADVIAVVRKQIKQRHDSFESFEKAGRDDLASTEKLEITVLEEFLPEALSDAEIEAIVDASIKEVGSSTKKEMGAIMKLVQEKAAGRADGKALSKAVVSRLK